MTALLPFRRLSICLLLVLASASLQPLLAHPLGNFTVNHFARIEAGPDRARVRYVVDLAEIPTFQEQQEADTDQDGTLSEAELSAFLQRVTPGWLSGLRLMVDGVPAELRLEGSSIVQAPGAAGLSTMRLFFDLTAQWTAAEGAVRLRFENGNRSEQAGWREVAVTPLAGAAVFDSTAYGNSLTDELKAYPEEQLQSPLDERFAEWSVVGGVAPVGSRPLLARDGRLITPQRDRFAELITTRDLTPTVVLTGLLLALLLGAAHAMSPGHGKSVVGAYLIGSRGTVRHAAFLGATVTITHTLGVFALGLVTLFASRYVLPEKLYPILSFLSGALVAGIGGTMLMRRLRDSNDLGGHHHHADGESHTHLPPESLTWRSLLALGVSGGIMPCPSALVLMLGAISLNRVGYGLLLVTAFSLGLAATLTAVGLAFVWGGRLLDRLPRANRALRLLPLLSATVITILGVVICWQALQQAGISLGQLWQAELEEARKASALAILAIGLLIGLRHALDTDHLAAVSTIVSERRSLLSSLLVGGLWGIGHTLSLLIAGVAVIFLHVSIADYEKPLEFGVAIMLIILGLNVLRRLVRGDKLHLHRHEHGGFEHVHPHFHDNSSSDGEDRLPTRTHHGFQLGIRPMIIGMIHGLAGSAALMLSVLATIDSTPLAFGYIIIFGIGSIGGMMIMSLLLSLPLHLTEISFSRADLVVRVLSGLFSLGFGLFMAYEIGFVEGLFR